MPQNLEELLGRRGTQTRHLADKDLLNTLERESPENIAQIVRELHAESAAIRPDLQSWKNRKAMSLLYEAVMQVVQAQLLLAEKRGQTFEPVPEVDEAIQDLQETHAELVGVG
jgi:hypothetical protein